MKKWLLNKKSLITVLALTIIISFTAILLPITVNAYGLAGKQTDLIATSNIDDWFQVVADEGDWTPTNDKVTVDAFGGAYALEGATYLTAQGQALGAFELSVNIKITELNDVENPMVGFIPWYLDKDNYLFVQLKMTQSEDYVVSPEEIADGYAFEQLIISGRYNGEAKYATSTSPQENTTFPFLNNLATLKKNPTHAEGHNLSVKFENSGSTATFYKVTVYYDGVSVGSTSIYYYNAVAKTSAMGFMAQDVKAEFSEAILDDFYATNNTAALARDWTESNDFTYKVLNGIDPWTFNEDNSISFDTTEIKNGSKVLSDYRVTGSNIAGYDTNRGFTVNPVARTESGLPENYEVKASFKVDEIKEYTTNREYKFGYGLLAWYKDDQNFVDVTLCRTVSGLVLSPETKIELVLSGWIDCSNAPVGTNVYTLPEDFDLTVDHTIRVEKKSIGFYVYLDDAAEPVISKRVIGTDDNYYYGYEGYNVKYTATALEGKAIYAPYDEVTVVDNHDGVWKSTGRSKEAWSFNDDTIMLAAREESDTLGKRSYLLGGSDISDRNVSIELNVNITLGNKNQLSELLLAPYLADDDNYVRIGLIWRDGKLYARVRSSTYLEEDEEEGRSPVLVLKEAEIGSVEIGEAIVIKAEKIENTISLYVNDNLVYGKVIYGISYPSQEFGIYAYNLDMTINSLETIGYKKYEWKSVGNWTTSGIKYNEWTINEEGYLIGDATYTKDMKKDTDDDDRNFAIQPNRLRDNYIVSARMKVTKQTEAEDRVGLVVWYVDEDNYLVFYLDHWRSDSTVPRTTFTGKINGEYLPVRYNHGAWMPEGDQVIADGLTRTELSQVTEWHTVTVVKEGSTFTCTVDGEYGALTYTVVSGMAEVPADSLVYSGIYVLNDEVIVSSYDVTALDTDIPGTLPGVFGEPINAEIVAPILTEYDEEDFVDEIDKITTEGNREEIKDPDDDNDDDGNVPRQYTKDIWLLAFGGIVIIGIIVIVTILKKRKNHRGEK